MRRLELPPGHAHPLARAALVLAVLGGLAAGSVWSGADDRTPPPAVSGSSARAAGARVDPSQIACDGPRRFDALLNQTGPFCVPKDSIPAVDHPMFVSARRARLPAAEPVLAVDLGGQSRAYPVRYLSFHEIVNDEVAGRPLVITFCPLCNSGVAFSRRVRGRVLTFGVSGQLNFANLVMFDRETDSRWQQLTGVAYSGALKGAHLRLIAVQLVAFGDWRAAHPSGRLMAPPQPDGFPYGRDPYSWYDHGPGEESVVVRGERIDGRLPPKERIFGVAAGGLALAFVAPEGGRGPVVEQAVLAGRPLVAFLTFGVAQPQRGYFLKDAPPGWAASVFDRRLGRATLSFAVDGEGFVDRSTGSHFDFSGVATDGPLAGRALRPVPAATSYWFAWWHFYPDTIVVRAGSG